MSHALSRLKRLNLCISMVFLLSLGWVGTAPAQPVLQAPEELCKALRFLAPRYGLEIKRSLAIAHVESHYRNIVSKDGYDYGYFQINRWTAGHFNVNLKRLMNDVWYQTEAHLHILSVKIHECASLGSEAYSCYHSKTPHFRQTYAAKVNAIYKKLNVKEVCK